MYRAVALAGLLAASALSLGEARLTGANAEACPTLHVKAGLPAVQGDYIAAAEQNGRRLYLGPGGAELRYELSARGVDGAAARRNKGAAAWLKADGWFVVQGETYLYGVTTDATNISGVTGWQVNGTNGTMSAPSGVNVSCTTCLDAPNWASGADCASGGATETQGCVAEGWTCEAYSSKGWCVDGKPAQGMTLKFGDGNNFPEKNCCACGGRWALTLNDAVQALNRSQEAERQLETAVMMLRRRLATAESVLVATAQNVSAVQRALPAVQDRALTTEHFLLNATRKSAAANAAAEQELGLAKAIYNRFQTLQNTTGEDADMIRKVAGDDIIAKLEILNRRIWAAWEPQGPTSVEAAEKRVSKLSESTDTLAKRRAQHAEVIMSKRLRGGVRGLRHSFRRLTAAAAPPQEDDPMH
eukprot:TRINITY_DN17000_c0_g1_i1.p1 TRINITY_DN17000_c0_g1~~TRINITY_DN17000_c0_g1_i1.p1  ORF type:complete len:415 (+),score=90.37 TRINITY_DN17000_c0_g1_i1:158-1402(+)